MKSSYLARFDFTFWIRIFAFFALAAAFSPVSHAQTWFDNYNAALKKASDENKPLIVMFSYGGDRRIKTTHLYSREFKKYAQENLVCSIIKIIYKGDIAYAQNSRDRDTVDFFKVSSTSAFILDPKSKKYESIRIWSGRPADFVQKLDEFKRKNMASEN